MNHDVRFSKARLLKIDRGGIVFDRLGKGFLPLRDRQEGSDFLVNLPMFTYRKSFNHGPLPGSPDKFRQVQQKKPRIAPGIVKQGFWRQRQVNLVAHGRLDLSSGGVNPILARRMRRSSNISGCRPLSSDRLVLYRQACGGETSERRKSHADDGAIS
ncbi:hypothetical protein [Sulfitobacter mediterraneus]|uniref:hypothetical protein n=1 Tax=Sulfitobacter mediterraneus TaxID=83219 RepID=UPI0021A55D6B|nr:hypothetical protein [Sulfitobacter mediterraneus]UWR11413.1 hypothetical protein K3753_00550 [Sulfitobacter mediterraneus]